MSSPYDRYDRASSRSRRGVWSHWVPLVITLTVATVGVAAWAWSQRKTDGEGEEEMEHEPGLDYENADYGDNPPYGAAANDRPPTTQVPPPPQSEGYPPSVPPGSVPPPPADGGPGASWGARMTGALRAPSPKQFLDSASKTVAAGVAATGAVVSKALASINEEEKPAYPDHETWSEEADRNKQAGVAKPKDGIKPRKSVAIVVSADNHVDDIDEDGFHEHAVSVAPPAA